MSASRKAIEACLQRWFTSFTGELNGIQLAALENHWENVMNDAALTRVDSWVIADRAVAELRKEGPL